LQALQQSAVTAVERIVATRDDINAIKLRISKRENADSDEKLKSMSERADALITSLDELEKVFRVPPQTTGIVFDEDKVSSHIAYANYYVSSTFAVPTRTAATFIALAHDATAKAIARLNGFLADDLLSFRSDVQSAGIGLLMNAEPVSTPN
jgi:hypothetical protein